MPQLSEKQNILIYGASLAALLFLLNWLELRLLIYRNAFEYYGAAIALIFLAAGIWIATHASRRNSTLPNFPADHLHAGSKFGITPREAEVLALMAAGLSNQEIAEKLFVTLNTIKSHNSKIFEKLDVSRRTQAVEKAKRTGILS